jgi:endonuclease/exonuclease/phosphatase (EEP) superfamily protein YafD
MRRPDRFVVASIVVLALGIFTWLVGRYFPERWAMTVAATYAPAEMHLAPPSLIALVAFAARRWRALVIALVALGFAVVVLAGFTISGPSGSSGSDRSFVVLTYNVDKWAFGGESIASSVKPRSPDVICLQEAGRYWWNKDPNVQADAFEKGLPDYRFVGEGENRVGSRHPIKEVHVEPLPPGPAARPLVDAVIALDAGEVHVVSVHLIPTLVSVKWSEDRGDAAGGDLGQIEDVRRRQAERLVEYVGKLGRPTILCGDFNAPPRTVPIRTITRALEDAWASRGNGFGFTSPASFARSRIDYVFVRGLVVRDVEVAELETSDHHALVAKLALDHQ